MIIPTVYFILKATILSATAQTFSQGSWKETGPSIAPLGLPGERTRLQEVLDVEGDRHRHTQGQREVVMHKYSNVLWEPGGGGEGGRGRGDSSVAVWVLEWGRGDIGKKDHDTFGTKGRV